MADTSVDAQGTDASQQDNGGVELTDVNTSQAPSPAVGMVTGGVDASPADLEAGKAEHKTDNVDGTAAANGDVALPGAPGADALTAERWRSLSALGGEHSSVELAWNNISLTIGPKRILNNLSGVIRPGNLTCIMGPSGAGKSSLLNILAGRTRASGKVQIEGNITANGVQVDPVQFRKRIAYVMQEDALFATQTPREALMFSAALRLPKSYTHAQRVSLVENIIVALGLTKCADTLIGSHMIPGISGGEKKRTAIGIELVASPDILFLDEPTSGLDSFAAYQVVRILKDLAAAGRTVVTTIHQPSSEVFDNFSNVLLLANGRLVYHSPVHDMTSYFARVGQQLAPQVDPKQFICHPNYNPADFIMFLLQQQTSEGIDLLAGEWIREVAAANTAIQAGDVEDGELRKRSLSASSFTVATKSARDNYAAKLKEKVERPGFCVQFRYLAQREVLNVVRDKGSMMARIGSTVFLNLIVACVFYMAADWEDTNGDSVPAVIKQVNSQFGVLVQLGIGGMFGLAQPTMLTFPLERPVFIREYASGAYSAVPYFLSKMMAEVPVTTMQAALMFLCTYWLTGLAANFFVLTFVVALLGMVASSTSLLIGAVAESVQVAMQLTPLLFVPQLLFAGFFIPITSIPVWLRWAQYLCSLKYSLNLLIVVEFENLPDSWPSAYSSDNYYDAVYGCSGADLVDGDCIESARVGNSYDSALFPRSEVSVNEVGFYLAILCGALVFFRVLALIALVFKARRH